MAALRLLPLALLARRSGGAGLRLDRLCGAESPRGRLCLLRGFGFRLCFCLSLRFGLCFGLRLGFRACGRFRARLFLCGGLLLFLGCGAGRGGFLPPCNNDNIAVQVRVKAAYLIVFAENVMTRPYSSGSSEADWVFPSIPCAERISVMSFPLIPSSFAN